MPNLDIRRYRAYPELMRSISVGELRQNPTRMLDEVELGESYSVTRHNRVIARVVPVSSSATIIPAKKQGGARTSAMTPVTLPAELSVNELLDELTGEW